MHFHVFIKNRYTNFKELQTDPRYTPLWDLCIKTVKNPEALAIIRFCNDYYRFAPVRTFIDYNREAINSLLAADKDMLFSEIRKEKDKDLIVFKPVVKQYLGAFWGMAFKYAIGGYKFENMTTSINREDYFGIRTASRFEKDES